MTAPAGQKPPDAGEPDARGGRERRQAFGAAVARVPWGKVAGRVFLLVVAGVSIYLVGPRVVEVFATAPQLSNIDLWWFPVIVALEAASFVSFWALTRSAVPEVSWFVAATSQLASNAVSRVVPGGAVAGGAVYYRMLSVSGIDPVSTAAALTATSLLTTLVLLALPLVALLVAAATAPIPDGLVPVAFGGAALFVALFGAGAVLILFDAPIRAIGRVGAALGRRLGRLFGKDRDPGASRIVQRRNEMRRGLGRRWHVALGSASAKWIFDYLALVAALWAVGARPRLSLVLLAYAASAVLAMIPITPGGLGFVEAGLTATLTIAGVASGDALLATLTYRLVSFWLPIPAGGIAWLLFTRRYGKPSEIEASAPS